jgi:uncharacterized protein YhfF
MSETTETVWRRYLATLPREHPHRRVPPTALSFRDCAALSTLLGLVLDGRKRATAALPIECAGAGDPPPGERAH